MHKVWIFILLLLPQNVIASEIHLSKERMSALDSVRAASKRVAAFNVGPRRAIRLIYFTPRDQQFRADRARAMQRIVVRCQTFYANQLAMRDHADMGFQLEKDGDGNPTVHHVTGDYPTEDYRTNTLQTMWPQLSRGFNFGSPNVYFIVIENGSDRLSDHGLDVGGVGGAWSKSRGFFLLPSVFDYVAVVHELGHAFSLLHNFRNDAFVMSYGLDADSLSVCNADYLSRSPFFNPDIFVGGHRTEGPSVRWLSRRSYNPYAKTIRVRIRLVSMEKIHQAIFLVKTTDKNSVAYGDYESVADITIPDTLRQIVDFPPAEVTISWNHPGVVPSSHGVNLFALDRHALAVRAVDIEGNYKDDGITLYAERPSPDFNGDGKVDFVDFMLFADAWKCIVGEAGCEARFDLDGDGEVGFGDFMIFSAAFNS